MIARLGLGLRVRFDDCVLRIRAQGTACTAPVWTCNIPGENLFCVEADVFRVPVRLRFKQL